MTTSSGRLFDTYTGYRIGILELLAQANKQIVLFDPDLSQCGLESPASIEALKLFFERSANEDCLRLMVHRVDFVERECPRLARLFSDFEHRVRIRSTAGEHRSLEQAFMVADGSHVLTRFHNDDPRGKMSFDDTRSASQFLAQFESLWERGQSGPSIAPLGI